MPAELEVRADLCILQFCGALESAEWEQEGRLTGRGGEHPEASRRGWEFGWGLKGREVQAGGTTYMGVEPEVSRNGKYKKIMWQVCMWSEQEEWGMGDGT